MKVKVSDAVGPVLDWMVAKCEGYDCQFDDEVSGPWLVPQEGYLHDEKPLSMFRPSTSGDTVIDIMERERIRVEPWTDKARAWAALAYKFQGWANPTSEFVFGPALRIAVCRCFVASKLGDEVDVPEELMK